MPREDYKGITVSAEVYQILQHLAEETHRSIPGMIEHLAKEEQKKLESTVEAR